MKKGVIVIVLSLLILVEGCAFKNIRLSFCNSNVEERVIKCIREERYDDADTICMAWLEQHPKDWEVQSLYGVVFMYKGNYGNAIDVLEASIPHLQREEYIAGLLNISLSFLYKGDLLEYCEAVDLLIKEVEEKRKLHHNERLISAIALFIQGEDDYSELLNPMEIVLFTKTQMPSDDQRIVQYWREVFTFNKADERDKVSFVNLIAKRPITPVLPQTTLSSFVVSIIAEKTNPTYLKPVIAYGR